MATTACTSASQAEVAGEMLDQDADEAFHPGADRAMHHDRHFLGAVGIDVERAEPFRRVSRPASMPHCQSRPMASRGTYSNFGP